MQEELISIIVPVYKVEKYIRKCVESILNQTYKNLEIILIDDGSPDSCGDICEEYAKVDSRIRIYHQENQGLSAARNTGMCHMTGKYVGFIDSDDYVAIDYIEKLYNSLKLYNADISVCAEEYVLEKSNGELQVIERPFRDYNGERVMKAEEALSSCLRQDYFEASAWAKLYKSSLFENVKFPVGYAYEDQGTTYKTFLKSKKVVYNGEHLYFYLQRAGSILHSNTGSKRYWDGIKMLEQQHTDVIKDYPQLINPANSRLISMYFHSFGGACITNDIDLKEYCWSKIKSLRFSVLRDSNARRKARIASLLSFFGMNVMELIITHK